MITERLQRAAFEAQVCMRPGFWISKNGYLWKHWRTFQEELHVDIAKGGKGRGRLREIARSLKSLPKTRVVRVGEHKAKMTERARFSSDMIVIPSDGGLIFFDEIRGSLIRYYGFGVVTPEQESERRTWQTFVNAPGFTVSHCRQFIEEQLLEGKHIRDLSAGDAKSVVGTICQDYTRLAQHMQDQGADEGPHCKCQAVDLNDALGKGFLQSVEDDFFKRFLGELLEIRDVINTTYVPSGSDNSPHNAVITQSGYHFIDTFPVLERAAFVHPLGVVAGWSVYSKATLAGFLNGDLDAVVVPLLEVSGLDISLTKRTRFAILLLAIALPSLSKNSYSHSMKTPAEFFNWLGRAYQLRDMKAFF